MPDVELKETCCILRLPEVERRTGFKGSYIYKLMRKNEFPQRVRIGVRAVGWDSRVIEAWIEKRIDHN